MRPIKFRGWHLQMGKMFTPEQMGADQLTILPSTGQFINVSSVDPKLSVIAPLDVMMPLEFTGLIDKNGKEIYEGDIMKVDNSKGEFFYTKVVHDIKDGGRFVAIDIYGGGRFAFDGWYRERAEVIGNIYENPELLP